MYQTFDEITNAADTGKKSSVRALQAWQYLIARAANRQLVRYGELAKIMGYSDNRPLTPILGHIMYYCSQQGLLPLTIIVVNQDGTPGDGFTETPRTEFDSTRERVFDFEWFKVYPPSPSEFKHSWDEATH